MCSWYTWFEPGRHVLLMYSRVHLLTGLLLLLLSDYFHDAVNQDPARGGQRVATVLMYLATPEEGETQACAGPRGPGGGNGGSLLRWYIEPPVSTEPATRCKDLASAETHWYALQASLQAVVMT
jgi:hypothetical protein